MTASEDRGHAEQEEATVAEVDREWSTMEKHFFILSVSGKPIYSRHGSEDKLVTVFGVMQALVSFVQSSNDTIRTIRAGNTKFVFLVEDPLILVVVSKTAQTERQLARELDCLYSLLVSILTSTQLKKIYEERRNFDLRRLLTGSERLIDHLINCLGSQLDLALSSVRCLQLDPAVRSAISSTIVATGSKIKKLVFAVLIADKRLVSLVRLEKYHIHPADLHIVFNLIDSSESFKSAESWTPICLPKFDATGFLHAHVSYLSEDCQACLLLVTVDKDIFFVLSEAKQKLVEKLRRNGHLDAINESLRAEAVGMSHIGIPEVRHFVYKNRSTSNYWSPKLEAPYLEKGERERVLSQYRYLQDCLESRSLRLIFEQFERETLFGWITDGIELYVLLEPLVTKDSAIKAVNKIMLWMRKEEDKLFIVEDAVF